jgi:hypothetical protein
MVLRRASPLLVGLLLALASPAAGCADSVVAGDAGTPDAGGRWEACCQSGRVSTCFCPAGAVCNYGWFTDCGDGTCEPGPSLPGARCGDGGAGTWEPCCVDGRVTTCFCSAGEACNYGWFTDCGGGTCEAGPGSGCGDGGAPRPDGHAVCCDFEAERLTTCACPGGLCAGGPFTTCARGRCVDLDAACTPDGSETGWYPCCEDGRVTSCHCPDGAACDPVPFTPCGDGTCAPFGTACPPTTFP